MTLFSGSAARLSKYWTVCWLALFMSVQGCERFNNQENRNTDTTAKKILKEEASRLYALHCTPCHGKTGKGGVGPDLTVSRYRHGKKQPQVVKSIMYGTDNGMPAFAAHLSEAQAEAIAMHLETFK